MAGLLTKVDQLRKQFSTGDASCSETQLFSHEVLNAMRLADEYSCIEPVPYVLPLDALAGFTVARVRSK